MNLDILIILALALAICLLSLSGHPTGDQKDGSRYYFVEGSRSPKGTYVLAFEIEGHKKVDWSRLTYGNMGEEYFNAMLGDEEGDNAKCYLYRRKGMSRVHRVMNLPFYPLIHRGGLRRVTWSKSQDVFEFDMAGYFRTSRIELVKVNQPGPLNQVDLLKVVEKRLDAHMRKSYPDHLVYRGYHYAFDVVKVEFQTSRRLVMTLHSYIPRAGGDWDEDIKLRLRLVKRGRSLKAKVESLQQISLTRERERD